MIQFLLFAALALGAVALLVVPLVRRPRPVAARSAYDLEVYRAQLAELERDAARGVIGAESRDAARREIERRVLALDVGTPALAAPAVGPSRFVAAAVIAVVVPVAAGALYLALGAPTLADRPLAERSTEAAASATDGGAIEDMVAGLATRLESEPDNLEGWVLLARSYGALGRNDEAVTALRRVVELSGEPGDTAMLAEYLVFAADGIVTPDALALFDQVAAAAPDDAAAAFYRGLAREQAGDGAGALEHWTALGRATAPDAPWLPSLRERIAAAASALGQDPDAALAGIPVPAPSAESPGPTDEDVAAAADMPAEDQQAMIQGMVEGLAERLRSEPDDVEGWLRLGNAYRVLGEAVKARDAYAGATLARPDDPALLAAYAEAMTEAAPAGVLPDGAHLIWRRVLELDAGNAAALWALGQAAALGGKAEVARELLTRLRDLLPEGSDERARVEHELHRLPAG